jgi:hypothetical protein
MTELSLDGVNGRPRSEPVYRPVVTSVLHGEPLSQLQSLVSDPAVGVLRALSAEVLAQRHSAPLLARTVGKAMVAALQGVVALDLSTFVVIALTLALMSLVPRTCRHGVRYDWIPRQFCGNSAGQAFRTD